MIHPKTDQQRCRLQEACKDILLFKNLDQVTLVFKNIFVFWLFSYLSFKQFFCGGAWVAQSVRHLTLDLRLGLDLRVVSFVLGVEPT